jgi:hypothetical protein
VAAAATSASGPPITARPSESEATRSSGHTSLERNAAELARAADQIDARWAHLQRNCLLNPVNQGDAQRAWFVVRDTMPTFKTGDSWCVTTLRDFATIVRDFGRAMSETSEAARKAGVYPGTIRETRRKMRLDWTGWDR